MAEVWNWRGAARCRVGNADALFVRGRHQREARRFCGTCPVRTECLAHALDQRVEVGIWGGMTERQRRALLKDRPQVQSWAELLEAARRAHYTACIDVADERDGSTGANGPDGGTARATGDGDGSVRRRDVSPSEDAAEHCDGSAGTDGGSAGEQGGAAEQGA